MTSMSVIPTIGLLIDQVLHIGRYIVHVSNRQRSVVKYDAITSHYHLLPIGDIPQAGIFLS